MNTIDRRELTPELLTAVEAAAHLRVKPQTLAVFRMQGRGPAFTRVGRSVRYPRESIADYLRCQTVATIDVAAR